MMRHGVLLLIVVLMMAAQAPQQVDLSSPKATAQSLYQAADRGDAEAIRQIFYTETEEQRALAEAYAEMIVSTKRLADVAQEKFGGAADAFAQGAAPAEDLTRLEAADVKMDGPDRASIRLPLAARAMNFRRTQQGWQLVITDFAGAAPEKIQGQIAMTRDISGVMNEVTEGIESDRYGTPQEAQQSLQQKMNEVMTRAVRSNLPATAPATAPAAAPATAPSTQPYSD